MAIFAHDNRVIQYQIESAPFPADLVLLQDSESPASVWQPIRDELSDLPSAGGRVLMCEWYDPSDTTPAETLRKLLQSIGFYECLVVAVGDAVQLVKKAKLQDSHLFTDELYFAEGLPKVGELKRSIREFCGL